MTEDKLNKLLVSVEAYTKQYEELPEDDEDRLKLLIKIGLILAVAAQSKEDQVGILGPLFQMAKQIPEDEFVKLQNEVCELLGEENGKRSN
jgi:hypothetical protein